MAADVDKVEEFGIFFVLGSTNEISQSSVFSGAMDEDRVRDCLENLTLTSTQDPIGCI